MPIGKTSWEKAVVLIILGKAFSIKDTDREIRSQFLSLKIPSVLVLKDVSYYKHRTPPPTKKNVFARDKCCLRCGEQRKENLSLEHLIPRSRFNKISKERNLDYGVGSWRNLATLCKSCNSAKDNRLPEEIGWEVNVGEPVGDIVINWQELFDIGISEK